jgi:DNA helicase-2/ATP-dependent DNA helicase PcrA
VVEEICDYLTSAPPKSFFLFAGAGSGKTRTLVEVLRRLTGVEPHAAGLLFASKLRARGQSIRVITYTRNAATVITGRLGENDLAKVSTIHAFCWDLIAGFDKDIREALLALNEESLKKAKAVAEGRKRGATANDLQSIAEFEVRPTKLGSIPRFLYNPDRNTYGDGALQHSQVLAITTWLLEMRPTLRKTLVDQHPVILIDESQDTMSGILDSFLKVVSEAPEKLAMGLLGDHRQRIYMDGHKDLPSLIPESWELPKLEMNHRSQKRIVDLINSIWAADVKGRTQPTSGVIQYARTEKSGGFARIFIGDSTLDPEEKIRRETLCAVRMAQISGATSWTNRKSGFQVLALEHRLAARRGEFLGVFDAMMLIDPEAARPQGNGENKGPASVKALLEDVSALAGCVDEDGKVDEFGAIEVLHRFDCLKDLPKNPPDQQERLAELHRAIQDFAAICSNTGCTVRQILNPLVACRVFKFAEPLERAFHDTDPPPAVPARASEEPVEDRKQRGLHHLLNARWREVSLYRTYLQGTANLATHQVVKGSEFENVMVVMDDEEAGGFLFSYDKLFGAVSLSRTDEANAAENKETTIDRTLRLLYVTCSRAREGLALVLWSSSPELALEKVRISGWFSVDEIEQVPGG